MQCNLHLTVPFCLRLEHYKHNKFGHLCYY